ncbi:4Fe-4S dicluster domain-containing protein [Desulfurispira natronophila]|uniref:Fe-S-cluster-containing dehydrogenase component n=1 Tax=Desulfurispira natronophila TaxID=682562 RepID=A0A7W7Y4G6_9BACT|nr:4Fe-4S dicluster domain-containing protein [Desulfurispira natronophila]MBB5021859.1 Fe-S-cluster-containing dehydrogenase component [Desulfurispira natronophila]
MEFSRRSFLGGLGAASAATLLAKSPAQAAPQGIDPDSYASLIDLTKCDGCPGQEMPECVSACRQANAHKFPEPDPDMLKPYWPQPFYEDWSNQRDVQSRLTPYNWIFVQRIKVEHEGETVEVSVPRRCMHCDNPPCAKLCPFGIKHKHPEGMVTIDPFLCFGGAKCRTVCPWDIPQRQAGVGIYTYLDPLPAGGGVMFKCDLCKDRLDRGEQPACIPACPRDAMTLGTRTEIDRMADELAQKYQGYIYGKKENGGTPTLYVSKVPFEKLQQGLMAQPQEKGGLVQLHNPQNMLERNEGWARLAMTAPVLGAITAFATSLAKGKSKGAATKANEDSKQGGQ